MYRTGDRGRWRTDGTLEFLGRLDDQVKIRGVRVEPGETEACLRRHDRVRDAAVVARSDDSGSITLAAYVVLAAAADGDRQTVVRELRDLANATLPAAAVPSAFVVTGELPRTISGKIDRRRLAELDVPAPAAVDAPPATALEAQIAVIWRETLRVEAAGRHDTFFALGGHSLLATQ